MGAMQLQFGSRDDRQQLAAGRRPSQAGRRNPGGRHGRRSIFRPPSAEQIQVNGKPALKAPDVQFLRSEHGQLVFGIGSGNYAFVVRP